MRRWIRTRGLVTVAVAACLLCETVTQAEPPKPAYTIIPFMLPNSNSIQSDVTDLNEMGQVVGYEIAPDGSICGLHLDLNSGDYTPLSGGTGGAINNLNQIVGNDDDLDRAVFWSEPSSVPVTLPPLSGDVRSRAGRLINDAGIICGTSHEIISIVEPPFSKEILKSVAWRVTIGANGVPQVSGPWLMELLGDSEWQISDINEVIDGTAQIVGTSRVDGVLRAVIGTIILEDDGTLTLGQDPISLGTLGLNDPSWSEGQGINDVGDVCGESDFHPCFSLGGDPLQPLAVPQSKPQYYMWNAMALGINNFGEIVGWLEFKYTDTGSAIGTKRAYLWRNGNAIDLNNEIGRKSGWDDLDWADCVNDAGVIGGFGQFDVYHRGFLLIPNEPPTGAGISVSPTSGLVTTEPGGTASFDVVLDTQPSAEVTIGISSSNTSEGMLEDPDDPFGPLLDSYDLVFNSTNWDQPQSVTVVGIDDSDVDGDVAYTIITAAATSTDPDYNGLDADDVSVTNQDDDAPPGGGSEVYLSTDTPKTIPDNESIASDILIVDDHQITNLTVNLDISHPRTSDLAVYLIDPAGGEPVQLFNFSGDNVVADFNGTSSFGLWTLEVYDNKRPKTGTLNSWSITVDY